MTGSPRPPLRLGLIGVDSPHAPSFTRLFGDGIDSAVPGATIAAAWRGEASADFPLSRDRIDTFASEVAALGVPFHAAPEDVATDCDALLVVSVDARSHPALFTRLAPYGKPVYVDTRFALTVREARAMLAAARVHSCLPLAGSPKRFAPAFRDALDLSRVEHIDLNGPLPTQPGHPFLAWYGVHLVDLAVAALGPGCARIDAPPGNPVTLTWADGRTATLGGPDAWSPLTTGRLRGPGGTREFAIHAEPAMVTGLLTALVAACRSGTANVPEAEVLDTVAIVEAAHRSRTSGAPVTLATGCPTTDGPLR